MIHLSRFLIGIRHKRVFRMKNYSGQLVDNILDIASEDFSRVAESTGNEEIILRDANDIFWAKLNRDDVIVEARKIYDWETQGYIEIEKQKVIDYMNEILPIVSKTLALKDDYFRIGMLFEFRVPVWEGLADENFGKYVYEKFIQFDAAGEKKEAEIRIVYKMGVPEGGIVKNFKDYRNVIIHIKRGKGIDDDGKEKKCLFVRVDIQQVFDPSRKGNKIEVSAFYNLAKEHLQKEVIPKLQAKGVNINYE